MDTRPAKRARVERNTCAKLISNTQNHKAKDRAVPSKAPRKPAHHKAETVEPVPSDFSSRAKSQWKIGPHVSAAGGVENTIINAAKVGANAFALFVKSQRKWTSSALTEHSISSFKSRMKAFGYSPSHILPHGSYLVNLGNPDSDKREKSYQCFLDDLKRCEELGLRLYNFHPGSTVGQATMDESISLIAECINRAHKETQNAVIVLENMAGSGNIVGSCFSDLGKIIEQVDDKTRVGVCLDTCQSHHANLSKGSY
ncbi:hypothetical protein IEO21_02382 [Rhodonia placenta]|uniref:Apurinic-apyrimidinic endonuclease 1 n=1 Tax=Rhodonia placenta TaxID=104341 RepID=A0A8H7P7P0_9APHY|nr:hypothetical protein IEO21_02382 [Postia placenta]